MVNNDANELISKAITDLRLKSYAELVLLVNRRNFLCYNEVAPSGKTYRLTITARFYDRDENDVEVKVAIRPHRRFFMGRSIKKTFVVFRCS